MKFLCSLLFFCLYFMSHIALAQPSFNCYQASHVDELAICNSSVLSALDVKMAGIYRQIQGQGLDKGSLSSVQGAWLQSRQLCYDDSQCLQQHYNQRIAELQGILGVSQPDNQNKKIFKQADGSTFFRKKDGSYLCLTKLGVRGKFQKQDAKLLCKIYMKRYSGMPETKPPFYYQTWRAWEQTIADHILKILQKYPSNRVNFEELGRMEAGKTVQQVIELRLVALELAGE